MRIQHSFSHVGLLTWNNLVLTQQLHNENLDCQVGISCSWARSWSLTKSKMSKLVGKVLLIIDDIFNPEVNNSVFGDNNISVRYFVVLGAHSFKGCEEHFVPHAFFNDPIQILNVLNQIIGNLSIGSFQSLINILNKPILNSFIFHQIVKN